MTAFLIQNMAPLMFAALVLSGGALTDRIGARTAFGIGLAIFTAASFACGLAPQFGVLIAARIANHMERVLREQSKDKYADQFKGFDWKTEEDAFMDGYHAHESGTETSAIGM